MRSGQATKPREDPAMKHNLYTVVGPVARIGASESMFLSKPQADARAHALTDNGGNIFTAAQPLEFKTGEVIGLTTKPEELPRYLGDILRPSSKEEIAVADRAHKAAVAIAKDAAARGARRFTEEKTAARQKQAGDKSRSDAKRQADEAKAKEASAKAAAEAKAKADAEAAAAAAGG
jgi:hypothetical protein